QTWILADYSWINGSLAKFTENETLLATRTTNVPDILLPVTFLGRSVRYGPGYNYGALLKSYSTFGPGYAVRMLSWIQYDFRLTPTSLPTIIDVDWVFVRKCSDIEPSIVMLNSSTSTPTTPVYLFQENFEWGTIGHVNNVINTYQRAIMQNGSATRWECSQATANNVLLANNFVNTTYRSQSTCLHLENHDDYYSNWRHSRAQAFIDITGFQSDLNFNISVQGKRSDGSYDNSIGEIQFTEDMDGDGSFNSPLDQHLTYVFDFNNYVEYEGTIDHYAVSTVNWAWIPITTDWDGITWYHISRNLTADWQHYKGFPLNKTMVRATIMNYQRIDASSASYYLWTNWDNFTMTSGVSPSVPPFDHYIEDFQSYSSSSDLIGQGLWTPDGANWDPSYVFNHPVCLDRGNGNKWGWWKNTAVYGAYWTLPGVVPRSGWFHVDFTSETGSTSGRVNQWLYDSTKTKAIAISYREGGKFQVFDNSVNYDTFTFNANTKYTFKWYVNVASNKQYFAVSNNNGTTWVTYDSDHALSGGHTGLVADGTGLVPWSAGSFIPTYARFTTGSFAFGYYTNYYLDNLNVSWPIAKPDITPPSIAIFSPANVSFISSNTVLLNASITDQALATTQYILDSNTPVSFDPCSLTSIIASDGVHILTIQATDVNGNQASSTIRFTVDTQSPQVQITSPVDGQAYPNGTIVLAFTIIEANPEAIWIVVNQSYSVLITGSIITLVLAPGSYTLEVHCRDHLGRTGSASVRVTVNQPVTPVEPPVDPPVVPPVVPVPVTFTMYYEPHALWINLALRNETQVTFNPESITRDDPRFVALPGGLLPAKPWYYRVDLADEAAFTSGMGRIHYRQSELASEIYENSLIVLRWNDASSIWEETGSVLNKPENYVEFVVRPGATYVLAARPKRNYDIVISATFACIATLGIVVTVSYKQRQKRGRSRVNATADARIVTRAKAAAGMSFATRDPAIIAQRVEKPAPAASPRCTLHKGLVHDRVVICSHCGAPYCVSCHFQLVDIDEHCWNCGQALDK
nr:hypothetical protein [Candidatus Sigynarchaeota archaeon]